jgi:hypothetical protein
VLKLSWNGSHGWQINTNFVQAYIKNIPNMHHFHHICGFWGEEEEEEEEEEEDIWNFCQSVSINWP